MVATISTNMFLHIAIVDTARNASCWPTEYEQTNSSHALPLRGLFLEFSCDLLPAFDTVHIGYVTRSPSHEPEFFIQLVLTDSILLSEWVLILSGVRRSCNYLLGHRHRGHHRRLGHHRLLSHHRISVSVNHDRLSHWLHLHLLLLLHHHLLLVRVHLTHRLLHHHFCTIFIICSRY